jgi:GT2 family glycosyltransferase
MSQQEGLPAEYMTVLVSIIIVSFNTKELLRQCIASIYERTHNLSYEMIVVDNASCDGSVEAIEKEFNNITLIRNSNNLGYAKANNQAILLARGKYILLLNSDTIVKEGTIEKLVSFIDRNPQAAAVGPKVLNPDGTLQNKGFFFPSVMFSLIVLFGINRFFPEKLKCRLFPKFYWSENDTREVDYVEGSCFLLSREIADKIGLLPEVFFMYFEEAEWCYLARKKKYKIWYVPTAEIIHLHASSPLHNREEVFGKSMAEFYRRNIGISKGIVISSLSLAASVIDLSGCVLFERNSKKTETIRAQIKRQIILLRRLTGVD